MATRTAEPGSIHATLPLSTRSVERFHASAQKSPSLVVAFGSSVEIVALEEERTLVVGRERPADIVCASPFLSRRHASFTLRNGSVHVRDLGSTNGLVVRKRSVTEASLSVGEHARLGPVHVTYQMLDEDERAGAIAGYDQFVLLLADEVERARVFKRSVGVLHVRALRDAAPRAGADTSETAIAPFVRTLLRTIDRVGVYGAGAVEIILPEATESDAIVTAHALAAARREGMPPLGIGVSTYPACKSAEELLSEGRAAAARATKDEPVAIHRPAAESEEIVTDFIAESARMRALVTLVDRVAKSPLPVLVLGETGSGKEVIARRLHDQSGRKTGKLVSVNCAAIAASLIESTLFGHEKGAFTGATSQQRGVFEAADGGTVFLDEIGELSPNAQAALLRTLETRKIVRVGSTHEIAVDVRIVAATHRNLEQMVAAGTFREDLLFRLNTVTLDVPPLRERVADVEPLARMFLTRMRSAGQTTIRAFEAEAVERLRAYAWPGNVRELRNAVERAAVVCAGARIAPVDLPDRVLSGPRVQSAADEPSKKSDASPGTPARPKKPPPPDVHDYATRMALAETEILMDALDRAGERQADAAELLQMPLRTFKYRLAKLGIRKRGYARVDG